MTVVTITEIAGLHVGTVESCTATEIKVTLESDAPQATAFNTGQPQGFPRLNGYVLMPNESGAVVGLITQVAIEPGPPSRRGADAALVEFPSMRRRLYINPLGTLEIARAAATPARRFRLRHGVTAFPSVGDSVLLPSREQLRAIVEASGTDTRVPIGVAPFANDAVVTIDPDKLFGRHIAVLGNTGSGKSCTVAGLVRWSIEAAAAQLGNGTVNSHFIVLDPNGEYLRCFNDLARHVDVKIYSVDPPEAGIERLRVPAWMWNSQEWTALLSASPGTQRPLLIQALRVLRGAQLGADADEHEEHDPELLIASSHLQGMRRYLESCRAGGVAVYGTFPKCQEIHLNLERFKDGLDQRVENAVDPLATTLDEVAQIAERIYERRQREVGQRTYRDPFGEPDLVEVIQAIDVALAELPVFDVTARMTEDSPTRFDLRELPSTIEFLAGLRGGQFVQHLAGLDVRLQTLLSDQRMMELIGPQEDDVEMPAWLSNHIGSGANRRGQITVLDLSLVPSEVLTTVMAVLARLVFETAQRHRRLVGETMPTALILEEAHNFVQRQGAEGDDAASSRCREIFEKIAKEGRKFGIGLVLSSQRPSELSPTIVAQCNSFLLHRIVNDRDQELVRKLVPDNAGALLKELPSLPAQQAILLGLATEIPVLVNVKPLTVKQQPHSRNPDFWEVWTGARPMTVDFETIVDDWRE
jgi:Helicase HerA, central domain